MRTVGLDLSLTSTGFVAWEKGEALEHCRVRSKYNGIYRLYDLQGQVQSLLDTHQPAAVAVEGYAMNQGQRGKGMSPGRMAATGEWHGIVRLLLFDRKIPTILVPPSTLKMFVALKGNAGKPEVVAAVLKHYGFATSYDDIADAYGLAVMAHYFFSGARCNHPKRARALQACEQVVWAPKRRRRALQV